MNKTRLPRNISVYILFGLLFAVVLLLVPRRGRFNYEYEKGAPWHYETLTADFDFPILKTQSQILEEKNAASSESKPCFKYDYDVLRQSMIDAEALPVSATDKSLIMEGLSVIYSRGILDSSELPEDTEVIMIQKDNHYSDHVTDDVYTISTARNALYLNLFYSAQVANADSLLDASGAYSLIKANLRRDIEGEKFFKSYNGDDVSLTRGYKSAGQIIVSKDEVISSDTYQVLESYKAEYEKSVGYSGPILLMWAGNGLLALLLCFLVFMAVLYSTPELFGQIKRLTYMLLIVAVTIAGALIMGKSYPELLYLVPFTLFCLYLCPYFYRTLVMLLYGIVLLPLPVYFNGGLEIYLTYLIAGTITIYVFGLLTKSWHQFLMCLAGFASMMLVWLSFRLIEGNLDLASTTRIGYLFVGAFLPVAGYPLIFLLEKLFGLVSPSRLEELCSTNNKLLHELQANAPGTFQHSLAVMNMCSVAARSIGADVPLVRAGAMYHDVGKLANPQCFIENETIGEAYHENLSPLQSATEILKHVPDGLEIARKYNVPKVVCDFIETHHGVSCTAYFYDKFVNEGGDPARKPAFTYSGRKPWTKEQAILMLCDSIEAASRTLKDNKPETFSAFVEKMVDSKIEDGQFDETILTLKELVTVKAVLKEYLGQLYHARIVYPGNKR